MKTSLEPKYKIVEV